MAQQWVKVWDPLIRFFHWSLVLSFIIAYFSEDDFMTLHVYAGYYILGLIAIRVIWGFIGTQHARFTDFVKSPSQIKSYIKSIFSFHPRRYLGHNPAGGAMVIALMISITLTGVLGLVLYGIEEAAGPLSNIGFYFGGASEEIFEELHEFFANFTVLLVVVHVGGVLLASFQHRENLIQSMISGKKPLDDPSGRSQPEGFNQKWKTGVMTLCERVMHQVSVQFKKR